MSTRGPERAPLSLHPMDRLPTDDRPERPRYVTNFVGSKQKLLDWIWANTPSGVRSVADAFSGSAAVAYMYKSRGLRVVTNDRLHYCHHIARAIIENTRDILTDQDIDMLVQSNPAASTFVADTFQGLWFPDDVLTLIDSMRANCDSLPGYKRDIALFALGRTCISSHGGFGHFFAVNKAHNRKMNVSSFAALVRKSALTINSLVFDNGQPCRARQGDIQDFLQSVDTDFVYLDPPYATNYARVDYEKFYHFAEGLMTYWDGKRIVSSSKVRLYETAGEVVSRGNAKAFMGRMLDGAMNIPGWLMSYRDNAFPTKDELSDMMKARGRAVKLSATNHQYGLRQGHAKAAQAATEYLFCCSPRATQVAYADNHKEHPMKDSTMHAFITGDILTTEAEAAADLGFSSNGDPTIRFVLCHEGQNRNGDFFTPEELQSKAPTAVNKKIDVQHAQDMDKIVGGILTSDYIDDQAGKRIECVGEIYTSVSNDAALAYRLMKRGVVKQVSMECTFREGECSICGKKFTERTALCAHLKNFKGGEFKGKPVYEILHDVTFQGVALLDKPGADVNAKILQVAALDAGGAAGAGTVAGTESDSCIEGESDAAAAAQKQQQESEMETKEHEAAVATAVADALKQAETAHAGALSAVEAKLAELTATNEALAAENAAFKQQIADAAAAAKKADRLAKAEVLVKKMTDAKILKSDDEAAAELTRLADLDEPLYLATEAATERALAVTLAASESDAATQAATAAAAAEQQRAEAALRAKPGESTRAADVGDTGPKTLTDKILAFTSPKQD